MKVLLDENLPKHLKQDFPDHELYTVRDQQWQGKKNGELLRELLAADFQVLLAFDKNLRYQQNFSKYPIAVVLLNAPDNTYLTLQQFVPRLRQLLQQPLSPGPQIVSL